MSLNRLWILEFQSECWRILWRLSAVWLKRKCASYMAYQGILSSRVGASAWLPHHIIRLVEWIVVTRWGWLLHLNHFRQNTKSITCVIVNWLLIFFPYLRCLLLKALSWVHVKHNLICSHRIMEPISLGDLQRNRWRPSIVAHLLNSSFGRILRILVYKVVLITQLHRLAIHLVETYLWSFLGREYVLRGWHQAVLDRNCKVLVQMTLRTIEDWCVIVDTILLNSIEVNCRSLFLVGGLGGRSTELAVVTGEDWLKLIEILVNGLVLDWPCLFTRFPHVFEHRITKLLHLETENHAA